MDSKVAIIDLGTNTFHLLVGKKQQTGFEILHEEKVAVRLGMGGINKGIITEDALSRAIAALQNFTKTLNQLRVSRVLAFGTSAFRNAENKQDIVARILQHTGIDVKIISGDEEAQYIYWGVRTAVDLGPKKSLVMDIGGGSVEFIICNDKEIFWKQSFEIGGQRLIEKYHQADPIPDESIRHMKEFFRENLYDLFEALRNFNPKVLVGSAGVFDTLSDIYCSHEGLVPTKPEAWLSIQGFRNIYEEIKIKNRADRLLIPGMIELRVDMIVAAGCLIDFVLENHPFSKIRVSNYSLKEGVLASERK